MTSIPIIRRLARAAAATLTAATLLSAIAMNAQGDQSTPTLGDEITLTATGSNSLNGADFHMTKLAGFSLVDTAAMVETDDTVRETVISALPAAADGSGIAADYEASKDGDPITWLARHGDAKDSPNWRLFAERMAITDLIANAAVVTGTPTMNDSGKITKVVFSGLEPGLYLLTDANIASEGTTKSSPILIGTAIMGTTPPIGNADGIVEVKNQRLEVGKTILEDGKETITADKSIGDPVNYRISVGIPDTSRYSNNPDAPYVFRVSDTMSKGQRYGNDLTVESSMDGITWDTLTAGSYTIATSGPTDGTGDMRIDVDLSTWAYEQGRNGMAGGELRISYSAILTKDAVIDGTGNTNSVTLTYSNDPGTSQTGEITPPDTRVYTHEFQFTKTKFDDVTPLEGATFTLYKGEGFTDADKYHHADQPDADVTATSGSDGVVRFSRLAAGTYWVEETGVPAGYRDLDVRFKVIITANNGAAASITFEKITSLGDALVKPTDDASTLHIVNIENLTQLPLTGSGGTILFTVTAVILALLGVGAALAAKRRQHALNE